MKKKDTFSYYNPVRISFGIDSLIKLREIAGKRRVALITSSIFKDLNIIDKIQSYVENLVFVIDSVKPNPTCEQLRILYEDLWKNNFDVIVALGGGSIIDTAKILSVHNDKKDFNFVENLIKNKIPKDEYKLIPVIAVPTTAGTGSEVTPWATVWDIYKKKKYSLHLPNLWCEACICDPQLTISMPKDITIQTALDALSHSFESIWNKNANPISTDYAIRAARSIINILPLLIKNLNNLEYRNKIMLAALQAGLAFSNTQTALAHALSYYITIHKGVPHGIACSFTLPDIIDSVIGINPDVDSAIYSICGELSSKKLRVFFKKIKISTCMNDYDINKNTLNGFSNKNERMKNSIIDVNYFLQSIKKDINYLSK